MADNPFADLIPANQFADLVPEPGERTDEQRMARIADLEKQQDELEAQDPSFFREVVGGTLADLRGIPEAGLQLLTGGVATAAGGAAAIPVTAFEAITGGEDPAGAGKAVIERFQELGQRVSRPRTEVGQRASEAIQAPLESVEQFADVVGEVSGDPNDVLGATLVKTAILGAPALFGLRRGGGTRTRAAEKPTLRQDVATIAREEGYTIPPSQVSAKTSAASLAEGLGGQAKTNQAAAVRNQGVSDNLSARAVGLEEGVAVTPQILQSIRTVAGESFEALKGVGQIVTDTAFRRDIALAVKDFKSAASDFPGLARDNIVKTIESLRVSEFQSSSAVAAMKRLRNDADVAFRSGDAELGNAYRGASKALEGAIERHLVRGGEESAAVLKQFRESRELIARTYSVQESLASRTTGNVNAANFAAQLNRGVPLTGELLTIAEFAANFPKAAALFKSGPGVFSAIDLLASGGVASGALALGAGPAAIFPLLGSLARPALRAAALSRPAQAGNVVRGASQRPTPAVVAGATTSAGTQ